MTLIINRFNAMPRYATHNVFHFKNLEQTETFVFRHGPHRNLIVQCRTNYIVKKPWQTLFFISAC